MTIRGTLCALGMVVALGCGVEQAASGMKDASGAAEFAETAAPSDAGRSALDLSKEISQATAPTAKATPRKIIYNSEVILFVEDFDKASLEIARLTQEAEGYLAESDLSGSTGSRRHGRWKVRVPIERFSAYVDAVVKLGELERRKTSSQDVTEEYFDLDARIKNKKIEETRLVKHLEASTGKLEEILAVEKEISRVREELERIQGRLQLLANLTSLTTVTITITERKDYVPPAAPTFAAQIGRTFQRSLAGFVAFCKGAVLVIVSLIPWLPLWALVLGLAWWVAHRLRRAFWGGVARLASAIRR